MSNILLLTIFTTLIINAIIFIANIFLGLDNLKIPTWVAKPLYACNVCMSHFYTLLCGLFWDYSLWHIAITWLLVIGINVIINRISYD